MFEYRRVPHNFELSNCSVWGSGSASMDVRSRSASLKLGELETIPDQPKMDLSVMENST
jgi:hypothetical protein